MSITEPMESGSRRARIAVVVAAVPGTWIVSAALLPDGAPPGIVLQGAVFGSLSALVAVGMVLVYRASRTINFAQAELAAVAAVVTVHLAAHRGWPYVPSVLVVLALAAATGALVEATVIRRLREAPRLIVAVASIGVAQVLVGVSVVLAVEVSKDRPLAQLDTPFPGSFSLRPVIFGGDHIAVLVVVPLVLIALGWFLRRSPYGIAVRAAADRSDRAALLGIPTARLSTLVWTVAGFLSGLAVILRVPLSGSVSFGAITGGGISLLVRTLAAVVIARFESLPVAAGAAVGIGVFEGVAAWNLGNSTYVDALLVLVILAALAAQRRGPSRAEDSALAATTFRAIREVRPVPAELRAVREVRLAGSALRLAALAAAVVFPLLVPPSRQQLGTVILIYAIVAVSLVVLTGWAGQISLGHWALAGLGGTATFALHTRHGVDFFLALPAGMLTAAAVSVVLGLPAMRMRGPFLAITTLAFGLTASTYFLQPRHFSWLVVEEAERPVLWGRLHLERDWQMYYLVLVAFVGVLLAASALRRSRTGRAMVAVRDNEAAAAAVSIPPVGVKLAAFAISGAMVGLAGSLYVLYQEGLNPDAFSPEVSLRLFSMVVIGGLGSPPGAVLGAIYVRGAEFFLPAGWTLVASGAGIVALLMFIPGGLGEVMYRVRDTYLRNVAARRGIASSSLGETTSARRAAADRAPPEGPDEEPTGSPLLDVRGVDVGYDGVQILFGVDLRVDDGEIVALLGTNGADKSTLLRTVSGLLTPSSGTITFDGQPIDRLSPGAIARLGIGQMPGGRGVFPSLSVADNLRVGGWLRRHDPGVDADLEATHRMFPILRERSTELAGSLSRGEQQMLNLAQAFLMRPRLLLVDELTLGLSPIVVDELLEAVRSMARSGTTIVIVEQRVTIALRVARRAVFLEKGEVCFSGPTAELLDRPDVLHSVYLQGARDRSKAEFTASATSQGHRTTVEQPAALTTRGLSKRYGGIVAANEVDLEVQAGEIVGVVGPNGAGKTTLFNMITGLTRPDQGTVWLNGIDVSDWPAHARARLALGRSFQDARLWPSLTVEGALAAASERHHPARAALPAMLRLPASTEAETEIAERTTDLIERFGLGAFANKFVAELSTGTRRIVDIAAIMAHRPNVLLLDEPSAGIAQRETEALVPLLRDLRTELDCTLVVIDHDTSLLAGLVERLVALERGRVIADGPTSQVLEEPAVVASFLGTAGA